MKSIKVSCISALLIVAAALLMGQGTISRELYTETATIANGASLSSTLDIKARPIVGIVMPAAWTTAKLTFQVSTDATNWVDMYNMFGDEFTSEAATGRFIAFSPYEFYPMRYVRVRSGTSAVPVNQAAFRSLVFVTRDQSTR